MGRSVFAVDRGLWTDPDFADEPYSEREAWVWLIGAAAWRESRVRGNAHPVTLVRGEFSFSVRFLAQKFQWTVSRTDRFLHRLLKRDMLRDASRDGAQVYSINKYNHFQVVGLPKRDSNGTPNETETKQQRDKEETLKQVNNKKEEERAPTGAVVPFKPKAQVAVIPDWIDPTAWAGYCELRRRKHAPMTEQAFDLIFKKLDRWRARGHDPTEVLNNSIQNGWTGIFEPKDSGSDGRNGRSKTKNGDFLSGIYEAVAGYTEGKP